MSKYNFLNTLDVFSSTDFLKINRKSSYKTKTGGIFTLIFILVIIIIFAMRIDSRSRGQRMTYKSELRNNNNELAILNTSPSSDNYFMMGVLITSELNQQGYQLNNLNLSLNLVTVTKSAYSDPIFNTKTYGLQVCTADHWKGTPQIQETYKKQYSLKNYLCLPKDIVINLQDKQGVIQYFSYIKMHRCVGWDCSNQSQLSSFSQAYQFKASTIFINSYISQNQLQYKTYYIQKLTDMDFGQSTFPQVNLQFSKYDVATDRNYLTPIPEKEMLRQEGAFLKEKKDPTYNQWGSGAEFFFQITIKRSTQKIILYRIDQRLIDIISYIGGLAATIFSIFQLIVSNYSSYAFEVEISRKIFKVSAEDNGQIKCDQTQKGKDIQAKPANKYLTNFCQYMKDKVGCCFKSSKQNDQYRKEFDKHIDIELIIQKLIVFQKMITKFAQNKLINLKQMQKYHTFQEAHQFRDYLSLFFYKQPEDYQHKNNHKPSSSVNFYQGPLEINLNPYNQENISRDSGRQKNGYDQNDRQNNGKRSQIYSQMNDDNLRSRDMINNEKNKYMK